MGDYKTLKHQSNGIFKNKGSKFIAFAYPINTEREVGILVKGLKKEYYDARHYCYAFVLGKNKEKFRAADDGEPSNSAGAPILGQLRSYDLTNVLVVVVRYFGGTKLGIPGLVQAYREATIDALNRTELIEEFERVQVSIKFEFIKMNDVMKIVKDFNLTIIEQKFDLDCNMILEFNKADSDLPLDKLKELGQTEEL